MSIVSTRRTTKSSKRTRYPGIRKVRGRYLVRVRVRCPRTGKEVDTQRRLPPGATLQDAIRMKQELARELRSGPKQKPERMRVGDFAQSWIGQQAQTKRVRVDTTLRNRVDVLEQHILPSLGDFYLDALTPRDIREWQAKMSVCRRDDGRPYSPTTINNWLRILRAMLRQAAVDLELQRDPSAAIRLLPETSEPRAVLNHKEAIAFLDAVRKDYPRHYPMTVVLFTTGLRFGEASALRWDDLDEENGLIHVRRRQVRSTIDATKTRKHRSVAVPEEVFEILREHRRDLFRRQAPGVDQGIMFPSNTGAYRQPSVLDKPFRAVAARLGIAKRITPHVLRRTYNNLMRQRGVDMITLRAMTGHSSERMTEHYSEVTVEEKQGAVRKGLAPILSVFAAQTGIKTGNPPALLSRKGSMSPVTSGDA